jgi:hypothetical protein
VTTAVVRLPNYRRYLDIPLDIAREGSGRLEMMDMQVWNQRREELMHEAQQDRLAKALRDSRKRRGAGGAPSLAWELERGAGRLLKLLRSLKPTD